MFTLLARCGSPAKRARNHHLVRAVTSAIAMVAASIGAASAGSGEKSNAPKVVN